MTAPANVLAVMDSTAAGLWTVANSASTDLATAMRERCEEFDRTGAAVAELIESDKEFDAAQAAWDTLAPGTDEDDDRTWDSQEWERLHKAMERRRVALARVQGARRHG